ncbi:MAG: type II secretion system protein N [Pseudomonadota bacterium]
MRTSFGLGLIAVAGFAAVLLIRLPLSWATHLLPRSVSCEEPSGSLWNGQCRSLRLQRSATAPPLLLGATHWRLRPLALLRAQLAANVQVQREGAQAEALVVLGLGGSIVLRGLQAQAPLDPTLMPGVPANWRGLLQVRDGNLRWRNGELQALAGVVTARDLTAQGPRATQYGSYELSFTPAVGGPELPPGQLRDLGGPLQVDGTVQLTPAMAWELNGHVLARADADAQLARELQYLGSPDAQGRRAFSARGE